MFLQTTVRLFICFKVKLYVSWCYINEPKLAPVYWPICCSFLHSRNISSHSTSVRLKTGPPYLFAMVKTNFGALKTPASAILQSSLASPRHKPLWTAHLLGVPSSLPFRVWSYPHSLPKPLEGPLPWETFQSLQVPPKRFIWSHQIKLIVSYCHLAVLFCPWAALTSLNSLQVAHGPDFGNDQGIGSGGLPSQQDNQLADGFWMALSG